MDKLKSSVKFAEKFILPLLATIIIVDFWDALNKAILFLLLFYLFLGVLEKLGFNIKILERLKNSRFGKLFIRLLRSSNPVLKYTTEHADETSEMIANGIIGGIKQVEKIKEEIKVKNQIGKVKLLIKHNKAFITACVLIVLYLLEARFHWATNLGIPADWLPYIAVGIVAFIFYVMFGEGFTFNDINQVREAAIQAKKDAVKAITSTTKEYNKVKARIDELKAMFNEGIPAEYADEWNILQLKEAKLRRALDGLEEDLQKAKKIFKTGKEE